VSILDADGQRLFGTPCDGQPASDPLPVLHDGLPVGWVLGQKDSHWQPQIAALLTFMVGQEAEKRTWQARC
jgi:hypothetical protein